MKVCIDSGRSGPYESMICSSGINEVAVNVAIGEALRQMLLLLGYQVVCINNTDTGIDDLEFYAQGAHDLGADAFVSIYCKSPESTNVNEVGVYYYPYAAEGKELAEDIRSVLPGMTSLKEADMKDENSRVLRLPDMPVVLVECECLMNEEDQMAIALGIAAGINRYLILGLTIDNKTHIMENKMKVKMNMPREKALTARLSAH